MLKLNGTSTTTATIEHQAFNHRLRYEQKTLFRAKRQTESTTKVLASRMSEQRQQFEGLTIEH